MTDQMIADKQLRTAAAEFLQEAAKDVLRKKAERLPAEGPPVIQRARQRALAAAETIAAALDIDPTLTERSQRDLDLMDELLRQLRPLARQTKVHAERERLVAESADEREIARLGRTNPSAAEDLDALSERCGAIADRVRAAALPDWNTPARIRELSEARLPYPEQVEEIAEQLRRLVKGALALPYPAAEAVRLAALADQITSGANGGVSGE